jgi:hypothetical protein
MNAMKHSRSLGEVLAREFHGRGHPVIAKASSAPSSPVRLWTCGCGWKPN